MIGWFRNYPTKEQQRAMREAAKMRQAGIEPAATQLSTGHSTSELLTREEGATGVEPVPSAWKADMSTGYT